MGWQSWSVTAADNDDSDAAINWAEGQAPSTVNNSARAMMAGLAAARIMLGGGVATGGTADAQTLTSGLSLSAYQQGVPLGFEAGSGLTNTTTTTLNVDSLGAKTVKRPDGTNLLAGDITAGGIYEVAYESGADVLILKNPSNVVGSAAQFRANTADKFLVTDRVWSAAAEVTLSDAATIAVDLSTGINFVVTLADNRTLGNPTNEKVGQSGVIRIVQDGTGSRTLAYGSDWEFAGGTAPVLSTAASSQDLLFYHVIAADRVYGSLIKAIA